MSTDHDGDLSRRTVLKRVALGSAGIVAGGALAGEDSASAAIERIDAPQEWFARRSWCRSGNRLLGGGDASLEGRTAAKEVFRPRSAVEIAALIRSLPAATPVACVCGGHESSNAAIVAGDGAVILDLAEFKDIDFHEAEGRRLVTVGSGAVFRELVEAVKERKGALPVGTGPGVGVAGYVVNGGLSGYFSRRLGLLGQRVTRMTVVTAAGEIRVLESGDELFTAMLGAGSALAIVVDVTFEMEREGVVQGAEQRVFAFETRDKAVAFTREALRFQRDHVLDDEAVSMEVVVTGTKVIVATFVFYDGFRGNMAEFVAPLETLGADMGLPVVASAHWDSWYETAAALWPVINGMKGSPLAMLQHCMGTEGRPADEILDFICDRVVAAAPLDEAPYSIVEIRTLGGAATSKAPIPSGNCVHRFFCDLVVLYDAHGTSLEERRGIADRVAGMMDEARHAEGLAVDFSGTHSQPDDAKAAVPEVIFGSAAMAEEVARLKKRFDPANRFRYHPYAKFL